MSYSEHPGKPQDLATISVQAQNPAMEIRLLNSNLEEIARDVGGLDARVPAGLYELQYDAGANVRSTLISLNAGDRRELAADIDFHSAAPITSSSEATDDERVAVEAISTRLREFSSTNQGQLVVFLRPTSGNPEVTPETFAPLGLFDENDHLISALEGDELQTDARGNHWAAACLRLDAGGYVLRLDPTTLRRAFNQSIWIEPGWQTLIFVLSMAGGPAPQVGSVHMTPVGTRWDPASSSTVAIETMMVGLRDGRGVSAPRVLDLMRDERTANPMLGIVAAYAALLADPPNHDFLLEMASILKRFWPDFPDVRALLPLLELSRRDIRKRDAQARRAVFKDVLPNLDWMIPISWPPMLLKAYQELLRADALWPDIELIADGSLADRAAARMLVGGLWSTWEPFDRLTENDSALQDFERAARPGLIERAAGGLLSHALTVIGKRTTALQWRLAAGRWIPESATEIQIKRYLTFRAGTTDYKNATLFVQSLTDTDVSVATGIPLMRVRPVLKRVRELLPSPTAPV